MDFSRWDQCSQMAEKITEYKDVKKKERKKNKMPRAEVKGVKRLTILNVADLKTKAMNK